MNCFTDAYKIYIKTTNTCNLDCKHCYTGGIQPNVERFNKKGTLGFLASLTKDYPFIRRFDYAFHGGEPMLVPVPEMVDFMENSREFTKVSTYGIQTNLVFKLTDEKMAFLKSLDYVGTSWDYDIRFSGEQSQKLWSNNVRTLVDEGVSMHVTVSLTKKLIREVEPIDVINMVQDLGVKHILFERLTTSGNAKDNLDIFPNSKELNGYFVKMWEQSIKYKTYERVHNLFLEPTAQMFVNKEPVEGQRRCRGCEQQILTFNSDGTIGGCADGALENTFGNINQRPLDVLQSKHRYKTIAKEKITNPNCLGCDVYDVCRGDCYRQKHDEFGCMAPKVLMQTLASGTDRGYLSKFIRG